MAATSNSVRLEIYDQIGEDYYGDGISAKSVVDFLRIHSNKSVDVRINSEGGFCYEGMQIFNALASHPKQVTCTVEGLAYSAASFIALAGDSLRMFRVSDFGIHCAATVAVGNKREMRSIAAWLDTLDNHIIDIYEAKTGKSRSQIIQWMDGESDGTLFSATEAHELGFCDEIIDPKGSVGGASNRSRSTGSASKSVLAARNRLARLRIRLP
jgi:ATP-dependent protease ClpP protease subunit